MINPAKVPVHVNPELQKVLYGVSAVRAVWTIVKKAFGGTDSPDSVQASAGPYRPSQWNDESDTIAARTLISNDKETYFFDAIISLDHSSELQVSEHPIQNGANIVDHAFIVPPKLNMSIGMSDAMESFYEGQFSGTPSRSVAAFEVLQKLQTDRLPLTITTRLKTYTNMLLTGINVTDDSSTTLGLRAAVTFRQIMQATVVPVRVKIPKSALSQTSGSTKTGGVQSEHVEKGSYLYQLEQKGRGLLSRG